VSTYLFFPPADQAQDDIWRYSCKAWGEKQAEKYIAGLHQHLQLLSERKEIWRTLPDKLVIPEDLNMKAYFSRYKQHYVFFRELSADIIGVMVILHEKSDMPVRLGEDLRDIEGKDL